MHPELLIFLVPLVLICLPVWFHAHKLYAFHSNLKKNNPVLWRLIGSDEKYIDNPTLWVRRFRIYMIGVAVFYISVLLFVALGW